LLSDDSVKISIQNHMQYIPLLTSTKHHLVFIAYYIRLRHETRS